MISKNFVFFVAMGLSAVGVLAQQAPESASNGARYASPAPYNASRPAAPPQGLAAAGKDAGIPSMGLPAGRPAPAAPMPTPLPSINKVQQALDMTAPMTPDEVTDLLKNLYERQRAATTNVTGRKPAKPVTSSETLDLSPGATPPIVRVALGQGTVISFMDSAGRPWEIADDQNFNGRAFEVKLIAPHLYSVTLKSREVAHVAVVLKNLPRPISITVVPAVDEVDYLKEFNVPRFLDGQPPPSVASSAKEGALAFNAPELLDYLYRTPPKEARPLSSQGLPNVMAWQISGSRMVLRTAGQVVIPAFFRRMASADGMTVFEVPLSPVVSITHGGALHRVSLSGISVEPVASRSPATPAR
jgi:intracellular multiplication protein IcmK